MRNPKLAHTLVHFSACWLPCALLRVHLTWILIRTKCVYGPT